MGNVLIHGINEQMVRTFNGTWGNVTPQKGDYTASLVTMASGDTVETAMANLEAKIPSITRLASQNLSASGGSLVFTDDSIGDDSLIDVYASIPNIAPSAISQSGTSVTVTFDAQDSAFDVAIVVQN